MNHLDTDRDKQAVIMLCGQFGDKSTEIAPLSLKEYNSIANWLVDNNLRPGVLFAFTESDFQDFSFPLDPTRVQRLLNRGASMALAMEKWSNQGIWVITRSCQDYPERIRRHLGNSAPPLLFGIGNKTLLNHGGLAIVGSRNIIPELTSLTESIATHAAKNNIGIISGGAKGVDQSAMHASIREGGRVIGVLANRLSRECNSKSYRLGIIEGRVVLTSPYNPDVSFDVGNAMGRNKCIYALADAALAISSSYGKGGTWAGLHEEKKRIQPKPLLIWLGSSAPPENTKVRNELDITGLDEQNIDQILFANVFGLSVVNVSGKGFRKESLSLDSIIVDSNIDEPAAGITEESQANEIVSAKMLPDEICTFLTEFRTLSEIEKQFNFSKQQILEMIGRALKAGDVVKDGKPVKYRMSGQGRLL